MHEEAHLLNTFFISYYMASSVSGQDVPNPVLLLATCCDQQEIFLQKPLLLRYHDNNKIPLLTKLVLSKWLDTGLVLAFL